MKYLATTTVSFGPGTRLGLTKDQAAARAHALTAAGRGQYVTRAAVQFKAGEVFSFDGDMPKGLADLVASPALVGKDGPEPILPLKRGADGKLSVDVTRADSAGTASADLPAVAGTTPPLL